MISFDPTEDQSAFSEAVHRFAVKDLRAHLHDADESGTVPPDVLRAGWGLGVVPAAIPEAYGGYADEQAAVTAVLAYEELAWGDLAATFQLLTPSLLAYPIRDLGSEAQKQAYLPRVCGGTSPRLTAALLEPKYQFDPRNLETTAEFDDGLYTLNGRKVYVPLANQAETVLVYANDAAAGSTQAFIIERNNPGLTVGEREKLMGVQALPTYPVTLTDCRVPPECRLGEEAGGQIGGLLARSNVALAALAVGVARAAYEYARDYAKDRVAFGEPIASRQSIAFMLAEMAIEIDATRMLVWEAAWQLDRGLDAAKDATLARLYADDMVVKVADGAVQVLGGHGYIRDHPVELWLRNARGFATFDGLAFV